MSPIRHIARASAISAALTLAALAGNAFAMNQDTQNGAVRADALASSVKAAIDQSVGRKSPDIEVTNANGHVTLTGWARTESELRTAITLANGIDGVKEVRNGGVRLWSSRSYDY